MTNELRVETAELRDLANRQSQAAAEFGEAGATTDGAGASVLSTHGVIASATAMATNAANGARSTAASTMQTVSSGLSEKLGTAASQYDQTDSQEQSNLNQQMHPGG
jgi:Excreted virulence factor EspC, type VII ESX diderm